MISIAIAITVGNYEIAYFRSIRELTGKSHAAFSALPEERRACACEMDTVMGRSCDTACVLTLFLRPCRFQLALALPEPRKLLPKGRGIAFDRLCGHDRACVMSQPNSEPRPSLGGMTPIRMLEATHGITRSQVDGPLAP